MSTNPTVRQTHRPGHATGHAIAAWCALCLYPVLLYVIFVVVINVSASIVDDAIESTPVGVITLLAMAALSPAPALWQGILAARAGSRFGTVAAVLAGLLLVGGLAAVLWALLAS
jgi:hypothetical protein